MPTDAALRCVVSRSAALLVALSVACSYPNACPPFSVQTLDTRRTVHLSVQCTASLVPYVVPFS